ncbi:exportin 1 [Cryptosporidium tyzzeri]|nr:exportin 1 [Cryptosporidium tyzzeri]
MDISLLLDLSQPYDLQKVEMLDELVGVMYGLRPGDRIIADKILSELKQKTDSWRIVGNILQLSSDYNTKFFALSILEKCIQFQWKILPFDQKTGIKQYITELCIELCQDEKILNENKHFLNKTNETLIMIVKQEWPDNWENFITEICNAAKTNQYICENTMKLLRLLSEEVFDFGEDQMVSKKVEKLMGILNQQFPQILSLILFVLTSYLENPQNIKVNLVVSSLQCLCHYLKWIPLNYILECDLRPQLPHSITSNGNNSIIYNLLQFLLDHFWGNPSFRLESIKCLTEISPLKFDENTKDSNGGLNKQIEDQMVQIWLSIVNRIKEVPNEYAQYDSMPNVSTSTRLYYERYFNYIALLLSSFIKTHRLSICEKYPETIQGMDFALERMVNISYIQNDEIFKVCVDFWLHFTQQLVFDVLDNSKKKSNDSSMMNSQAKSSPLFLLKNDTFGNIDNSDPHRQENPFNNPEEYSSRLVHYQSLLCDVRKMVICRMAKPQEVYIAIDPETGEVTRENIPDTDEISLYKSLREILIYLSNLGQNYMEKIILQLLQEEFDVVCINCGVICTCNSSSGNQWNPIKLNRLCWAVGSISGSLSKNIERRLIIEVIKSLLMLCERKRGKANKAAVASCVMYVVGQYPRFLRDHWKFLQTVINKLFEFMHETFPGVKDMACEAFLKIATKCKKSMSSNNFIDGNNRGLSNQMLPEIIDGGSQEIKFLKYMIGYSHELKQHLDDKQILILIQGISLTISSLKDVDEQYLYVTELLLIFDSLYWKDIISRLVELRSNPDNQGIINELCSMECSQKLIIIVRIMETIASSCGVGFARVLIERSSFLIELYKLYSNFIAGEVQRKGIVIISHAHIKQLRISKKEIIKLINSFISFIAPRKKLKLSENKNLSGYITDIQSILYHNITGTEMLQYIIHPIIIPVLEDYHACISEIKESQVLILSSTIIVRLNDIVKANNDLFNAIIYHLFECTLSMIKDNFHAYPDHREFFYSFLADCNEFCFLQLFNLPGNILTLYIESIIWAIRHEQPNMAEKGLIVLYNFLINLINHNSSKDNGIQSSCAQNNTLFQFCHAFYLSIIREIFCVLTDTLHTSGFQYQTMVLYELIKISEFSLFEGNQGNKQTNTASNSSLICDSCQGTTCKISKVGVMEYIADLLIKSFITVQKEQVEVFVLELFNSVHSKTISDFQRHVHDFLIQIKEFTNEESKQMFEIEKGIALKRAIEIENSKQWMIPGLINQEIGLNSNSGEGDDDDIEDDDEDE